jgi:hypothetical protein
LGKNSAFSLGPKKITVILDRVGLSRDFPDTNGRPASSPTLNMRTLTLVPICAVAFLEDDGEDKDDSDWVSDNDSVMSDDGESGE